MKINRFKTVLNRLQKKKISMKQIKNDLKRNEKFKRSGRQRTDDK